VLVALLFERSALPEDPRAARQRVADALCKRCTNFTPEPTARSNAVTVWYAEGYHIDFAVYRTYTDDFGQQKIEHASTEWKARDPQEIERRDNGEPRGRPVDEGTGGTASANRTLPEVVHALAALMESSGGTDRLYARRRVLQAALRAR
jgi:hypothetical protein